jgi:hypothetical protein
MHTAETPRVLRLQVLPQPVSAMRRLPRRPMKLTMIMSRISARSDDVRASKLPPRVAAHWEPIPHVSVALREWFGIQGYVPFRQSASCEE